MTSEEGFRGAFEDHEVARFMGGLALESPANFTDEEFLGLAFRLRESGAELQEAVRSDFKSLTPSEQATLFGMLIDADPESRAFWEESLEYRPEEI